MANPRSRGGCWTCRSKRRKCDEAKPTCNICNASGVQCGGYELQLAEFRAQGNYDGQMICRLTRGTAPERKVAKTRRKKSSTVRTEKPVVPEPAAESQGRLSQKARNAVPEPAVERARNATASEPSDTIVVQHGSTIGPTALPMHDVSGKRQVSPSNPQRPKVTVAGPKPQELERCHNTGATHIFDESASRDTGSNPQSLPDPALHDHGRFNPLEDFDPDWMNTDMNPFLTDDALSLALLQDLDDFGGKSPVMPYFEPAKLGVVSLPSATTASSPDEPSLASLEMLNNPVDAPVVPEAVQGIEVVGHHDLDLGFDDALEAIEDDETAIVIDENETMVTESFVPEAHSTWELQLRQPLNRTSSFTWPSRQPHGQEYSSSVSYWEMPFQSIQQIDTTSPFDSYLFNHFFSVLAPSLYPIAPDRNPYTLVYGKMASSSLPLRAAILEASARHLSCMGQLPSGVVALYGQSSMETFKTAFSNWTQADALAATLLLSISAEFVGTGTDAWRSKLRRARSLLVDHPSTNTFDGPITTPFLRLQYNWMLTIGRVLQNDAKLVEETEHLDFIEDEGIADETFSHSQARWFSNLPDYKYFGYFKEATRLAHNATIAHNSSPKAMLQLIPDAADLLQSLRAWSPEPATVSAPYAARTAQVNEVWQQGLLCYIYADICALPSSDHRIQECIRRASDALHKLAWIQSITWPMFMLGVHAMQPAHREILESSYIAMSSTLHFATPRAIVNFLHRVWKAMDVSEARDSNWRAIMKETGVQLNLFL